jgi:rare lipoprotein A (peptidoglycan hydrolase)
MPTANPSLGDALARITTATQAAAQIAATSAVIAPVVEPGTQAETASPVPIAVSLAPVAEPVAEAAPPVPAAAAPPPIGSAPAKSKAAATTPKAPTTAAAKPAPTKTAARKPSKDRLAARSAKIVEPTAAKNKHQRLAVAEPKPMLVRCVGRPETGKAAWYGGRYLGRRTSSGERLDRIHATAAHRTLPLNSLARVTNLDNGRSVIVRVTDRGPVSESLLIDMSPLAADQLAMKTAGIVPVKVEQVVEVASSDE